MNSQKHLKRDKQEQINRDKQVENKWNLSQLSKPLSGDGGKEKLPKMFFEEETLRGTRLRRETHPHLGNTECEGNTDNVKMRSMALGAAVVPAEDLGSSRGRRDLDLQYLHKFVWGSAKRERGRKTIRIVR